MILLHFYYFSSVVSNRFLVFLSFITNKEQSHCARAGVSSDHCSYIINDLCLYLIFFFYFARQGLLVYLAQKKKEEGQDLDAVAEWAELHKQNIVHLFTVDDLNHLYRGGRVSKTTAVLGGMLNIKPILHVDEEGKLIPIGKVRGTIN